MREDGRRPSPARGRLLLVPAVVVVGLGVSAWQPFTVPELLEFGRQAAGVPMLAVAVVLAMVLLFSFGLPGSLGLWLIAPFYPPALAILLLLAGSVGGALGAYFLSSRLRGGWQPEGFSLRVTNLLARRSDLVTQTALRVLPGFPHAAVNFPAGMLRLPLPTFLAAAAIGLAIKCWVYVTAIHGLVAAAERGSGVGAATLAPLLILSVLLLLGNWVRQRVAGAPDLLVENNGGSEMSAAEIDAWFAAAPPAQQATLARLRTLVKASGKNVVEEIKWSRPCYSTPGGLFCYLQSAKNHVTLGFQKGALLDDPASLLEGSGKELRHLKFRETSDIDERAVRALLEQAVRL
jgi:uncharacterized membrane protein YdjX (TVP38/TMEM64 family)